MTTTTTTTTTTSHTTAFASILINLVIATTTTICIATANFAPQHGHWFGLGWVSCLLTPLLRLLPMILATAGAIIVLAIVMTAVTNIKTNRMSGAVTLPIDVILTATIATSITVAAATMATMAIQTCTTTVQAPSWVLLPVHSQPLPLFSLSVLLPLLLLPLLLFFPLLSLHPLTLLLPCHPFAPSPAPEFVSVSDHALAPPILMFLLPGQTGWKH